MAYLDFAAYQDSIERGQYEPCDLCGEPAEVPPFVAQNPDAAHVCEACSREGGEEARSELREGEPPDIASVEIR